MRGKILHYKKIYLNMRKKLDKASKMWYNIVGWYKKKKNKLLVAAAALASIKPKCCRCCSLSEGAVGASASYRRNRRSACAALIFRGQTEFTERKKGRVTPAYVLHHHLTAKRYGFWFVCVRVLSRLH